MDNFGANLANSDNYLNTVNGDVITRNGACIFIPMIKQ